MSGDRTSETADPRRTAGDDAAPRQARASEAGETRRTASAIARLRWIGSAVIVIAALGITSLVSTLLGRIGDHVLPAAHADLVWKVRRGAREIAGAADVGLAVREATLVEQSVREFIDSESVVTIVAVDTSGALVYRYDAASASGAAGSEGTRIAGLDPFAGRAGRVRENDEVVTAWADSEIGEAVVGKVALAMSKRGLDEAARVLARARWVTALGAFGAALAGVLLLAWSTRAVQLRDEQLAERARGLEALLNERSRAADQARAQQRLLDRVFDHAVDLMAIVGRDGTVLAVNRVALEAAGTTRDAVLGQPLWDTPWWTHDAALQRQIREVVDTAVETGEPAAFDATHPGTDGHARRIEFAIRPVLDDTGRVELLVTEGRDVTERYAAEARRATLEAQLQSARRLESLGRLAGGVAHDFNNLLTVIGGNAHLLADELKERESLRELVQEIASASESAAGLTQQLLAFARKQRVEPKVIDLVERVAGLRRMLERVLGAGIKVSVSAEGPAAQVRIDPSQLEQIIVNLAVNARDAMPDGGTLGITVTSTVTLPEELRARVADERSDRPWALLEVSDEGVGIAPDVLARVFEPFFTTKAVGHGTGLGLASVHGAVEQAGGVIDVQSAVGAGTAFRIYLPRTVDAREVSAASPSAASPPTRATAAAHIVLVEDQALVRETVARQLRSLGYEVTTFPGPREAMRAFEEPSTRCDVLISDVVMPELSGPALVSALRERRPTLGALLISGYPDDVIAARGLDGLEVLAKPFSREQLQQAIRAVLDARAQHTSRDDAQPKAD